MSTLEVVKDFEHKGYRCVLVFHGDGVHCGYVELPPLHWLWGRASSFDEVLNSLKVHGGITWSRDCPSGDEGEVECGEGTWFIGFDCNHHRDLPDFKRALTRGLITREQYEKARRVQELFGMDGDATFKDAAYAERELRKLVEQIVDGDAERNTQQRKEAEHEG